MSVFDRLLLNGYDYKGFRFRSEEPRPRGGGELTPKRVLEGVLGGGHPLHGGAHSARVDEREHVAHAFGGGMTANE